MKGIVFVLIAVLGVTACATDSAPRDPSWVAERTQLERDDFKKIMTGRSPHVRGVTGSGADTGYYQAFVRGWKDLKGGRTGSTSEGFQIYVATNHTGRWHHYRHAWDSDGTRLDTTAIGSNVDCASYGCRFYEDVGVSVSRTYLEAHRTSPVNLKISGAGGEVVVRVPTGYVAGFLARFDGKTMAGK